MKKLSLLLFFLALHAFAGAKGTGDISMKYETWLIDSASVKLFGQFNTAVKEGKLWGDENTASNIYDVLAKEYPDSKLTKDARAILTKELVNFGEQKIDAYVKGYHDFGNINRKRESVKDSSAAVREKYELIYRVVHTPYINTAKMLIKANNLLSKDSASLKTLAPKIKFLSAMSAFQEETGAPSEQEALKLAHEAYRADTSCAYTALMLANLMLNTKIDSALVYAKKARILAPELQLAHYCLGYIYSEKKMYKESIDAYNTAISICPDFISALINIAVIYQNNMHDPDKALEIDKKVTTIEPGFILGLVNTANVLAAQEKYTEARAYLAKAEKAVVIRAYPDHYKVYNNLAGLFTTLNEKDSVAWALRKIVQKKEAGADEYNRLANAFNNIKEPDSAIFYAKKSVDMWPGQVFGLKLLGYLLATGGNLDEALVNYKLAMEADPSDWISAYNAAKVYSNKNDKENAQKYLLKANALEIRHYRKVLNDDPSKEDAANASRILAQLYSDNIDKIDSAIFFYKKNLDLDQDNLNSMTNLAFLYLNQGQHADQSLLLLKRAAELYPSDNTTYYNLACFYSRQKTETEAIKYLEMALQKGYKKKELIANDTDLDNIRNTDAFKKLMQKYLN